MIALSKEFLKRARWTSVRLHRCFLLISVSCCSLFECDVSTADFGYEDYFNAKEVPPVLEVDVYDVIRADVFEPKANFLKSFY